MPQLPITMPQLGESIAEATIVSLAVKPGDEVRGDQEIIEVETNKAVMGVTSPCPGRVKEIIAEIQQSYPVGAILGYLEVSEEDAKRLGYDTVQVPPAGELNDKGKTSKAKTPEKVEPTVRGLPVPAHAAGAGFLSPRLKARMAELRLRSSDLAGVAGSGSAGRVTIDDLETFMSQLEQHRTSPASSMRVAVADAMRRSWTRPIATVGLPLNLDPVLAHRKTLDPKPGPALYALRALGVALSENSAAAGRLIGEHLVHPASIDIGFAVEAEDGVLVPVIRDVDKSSLKDLVPKYDALVELARQRRVSPADTRNSIATVTNFGTFGLTWATPIPLPEQTLVLGLGAGRIVPHWDATKQQFVPITEAYLTLSFDHRVLDGGAAGRLLARVGKLLSQPETL